ncbi:MAG TPA: hypothetical protein VGM23_12765, partial [Armatimonadota bacterium]
MIMRNRWSAVQYGVFLPVLLSLFFFPIVSRAENPPAQPVDVLFIGDCTPPSMQDACWAAFVAACGKSGVRCYGVPLDQKAATWLTPEHLKQFHVIVVCGTLGVHQDNMDGFYTDSGKKVLDMLDDYYRAGGSILWAPYAESNGGTYWTRQVGARYDAASLEEDLYDPGNIVDANPTLSDGHLEFYRYLWTAQVTPHPVTEGVRGLLLPTMGEHSWPGTVPMKFGASWQVLVRGKESTRTVGNACSLTSGQKDFTPDVKGTYAASPELVGVRDSLGASGRMMVYPFYMTATWGNFGHWAMKDAFMLNGAEGHPSDGLRLFVNGCQWLADPARKAGKGGFPAPKPEGRTVIPPLDWKKADF